VHIIIIIIIIVVVVVVVVVGCCHSEGKSEPSHTLSMLTIRRLGLLKHMTIVSSTFRGTKTLSQGFIYLVLCLYGHLVTLYENKH
jgi:hypothetical protein